MERYDIYKDISLRTGGDIYIGVVGPVRTGKSTFISKFMEKIVVPNINNKLQKQIAMDEMPQSADGKTIMTTQPKFIPANAVKVQFKNKATANVRLVDCVGYLIDGVSGHMEDDKPRLVKTPWSETEIPFEKAAEIGTKKVVTEHSTIAVVVTTDGSFSDINRENYIPAEDRVIKELKECKKPFVIVVNSSTPDSESCIKLADSLQLKHCVPVITCNVLEMTSSDICEIMEKILLEFPMYGFNLSIPEWMRALPVDSPIISEITEKLKNSSQNMTKMCDFANLSAEFKDDENFNPIEVKELKLGEGVGEYTLSAKEGFFYKVLSKECDEDIVDEYSLMNFVKSFADNRKDYLKVKSALDDAKNNGYGVVLPTLDELDLEEPALVKQGGKYGVKLKASAPSLHILKVDVCTEVSPIVGTEKQGEDLVNYLMSQFEDNPSGIWQTNMFGKSLHDLVNEGLSGKLVAMPKEAQSKMRKTLTRIVNENKGGLICILL
ncbi:MAG: stage IV sporulation protein A [Clostridiales bacterium]|nr:stage IV sporulation protein A [Clostridiales bacterium]